MVLPLLLPNKDDVLRYFYGRFKDSAVNKKSKDMCQLMMDTIISYLPKDSCFVHIFIGSNRQSADIDNVMRLEKQKEFSSLMYPYWVPIVEQMNIQYPQHNWVFEQGSLSDDIKALEKPQEVVNTSLYGSGWTKPLVRGHPNKTLEHPFWYNFYDPQSIKINGYDLDLKDKINRYHAWRLYLVYGGKKLVFFDDKEKFVKNLMTKVQDYPPDMTIVGQYFDSDLHIADGKPFDYCKRMIATKVYVKQYDKQQGKYYDQQK